MVQSMTDSIPIKGFNRVELIVRENQISDAVRQFNEVLGLRIVFPHRIAGVPVLSATDFDGSIEFIAPVDGEGPFAARLDRCGAGQIGPLVWEVSDMDQTRRWLSHNGYRIFYEYDSSKGNEFERASKVHQLILDPSQWFGFSVTLMQRG
jgi:Glyoxalase/Bleomycin resistance protein/Dioxygenase superfamily